ncbi:helix-turn-helix domain-containing protein [Candidatus Gracilibacteria bacterium]|nr:helix-turn-helix domain-containing protein [Candidatus Gracilibacteria bacterium]MCF7898500.1 helix-turn-helix domain-containing protein [Candidatus Paceibacterota bacterium]
MSVLKQDEDSTVFTSQELIAYRKSLCLTQKQFAGKFEIPLSTLRKWEQGLSIPSISLAKLQLINSIIDWKNNEAKIATAIAKEKKNAKHKVKLNKNSPLRYKNGETQGQCWERIAKIGREIIQKKRTSRYSIKRLAFIVQELPSDFDRDDSCGIFIETKKYLRTLNDEMRRVFALTYLAHNDFERRCNWFLSKT